MVGTWLLKSRTPYQPLGPIIHQTNNSEPLWPDSMHYVNEKVIYMIWQFTQKYLCCVRGKWPRNIFFDGLKLFQGAIQMEWMAWEGCQKQSCTKKFDTLKHFFPKKVGQAPSIMVGTEKHPILKQVVVIQPHKIMDLDLRMKSNPVNWEDEVQPSELRGWSPGMSPFGGFVWNFPYLFFFCNFDWLSTPLGGLHDFYSL